MAAPLVVDVRSELVKDAWTTGAKPQEPDRDFQSPKDPRRYPPHIPYFLLEPAALTAHSINKEALRFPDTARNARDSMLTAREQQLWNRLEKLENKKARKASYRRTRSLLNSPLYPATSEAGLPDDDTELGTSSL